MSRGEAEQAAGRLAASQSSFITDVQRRRFVEHSAARRWVALRRWREINKRSYVPLRPPACPAGRAGGPTVTHVRFRVRRLDRRRAAVVLVDSISRPPPPPSPCTIESSVTQSSWQLPDHAPGWPERRLDEQRWTSLVRCSCC